MKNENKSNVAPADQAFKVAVPWGEFRTLAGGALIWNHNPLLAMTRDEQYRQNVLNGFIKAATPVEVDVLPPIPEWAKSDSLGGLVPSEIREELRAHARHAWYMGLDVGMRDAPAAYETTLPDLARLLGAASKEDKAVKLSPIAAGTLYNAVTTAAPASSTAPLQAPGHAAHTFTGENLALLKALAQDKAADGANFSMDVGCMFVLAMIDRIEASAADVARLDFVLDNSVFICTIDHGMYQLMTQDADEE